MHHGFTRHDSAERMENRREVGVEGGTGEGVNRAENGYDDIVLFRKEYTRKLYHYLGLC